MSHNLVNIEQCLEEAKRRRLAFWDRSVMASGQSSLVLTIPQPIKEALYLAAGRSRVLIHQLTQNALLVELFSQPVSSESQIIHTETPIVHSRRNGTSGFSLIELLIVISLITIIAALLVPRLYGRNDQQLVQTQIVYRLRERREAARHLAPKTSQDSTLGYTQPPLLIDFKTPDTTRPLRIEGTDTNSDTVDDDTGLPLTRFDAGTGQWSYAYEGTPLALPRNWNVVNPTNPIRTEVSAQTEEGVTYGNVKGVPAYAIGFDTQGRPWADTDGNGSLDATPESLSSGTSGEAKFWTIYASNGSNTIGIAVHGTGLIEVWRFADGAWKGWRNRTP